MSYTAAARISQPRLEQYRFHTTTNKREYQTRYNVDAVGTPVRLVADTPLAAPSGRALYFAARQPSPGLATDSHRQHLLDMSLSAIPPHQPRNTFHRPRTHHTTSLVARTTTHTPAGARAATTQAAPALAQDR